MRNDHWKTVFDPNRRFADTLAFLIPVGALALYSLVALALAGWRYVEFARDGLMGPRMWPSLLASVGFAGVMLALCINALLAKKWSIRVLAFFAPLMATITLYGRYVLDRITEVDHPFSFWTWLYLLLEVATGAACALAWNTDVRDGGPVPPMIE